LTRSALLYMAVAAVVIDLDQHIKQVERTGGNTKYLKALRKQSRFAVATHNPKNVHVQRDVFGVRGVLLAIEKPAQEVIDEWGAEDDKLDKLAEESKNVWYYDYIDYDSRCVFCTASEIRLQAKGTQGIVEICREDHNLPFLPWAAMLGGNTLEAKEEDKYHPLLYSLRTSGNWDNVNVIRTLYMSEAIAHAAAPRIVEEGPSEERAEIDYGDPSQAIKAPTGNTVKPFPPPVLDQSMATVDDRLTAQINQSTVSRVLMGGEIAAGTSFASLNLQTQTALGALKPAKELAEKALAEIFVMMLLWAKESSTPLMAYGSDKHLDLGKQYILEVENIPEEDLYIDVELVADLPTDKLQKANTAGMLTQFGYSRERALEDMGVSDPQGEMKQWYGEKYIDHIFEMAKQKQMLEMQAEMANQQAQEQMGMQQQAQQEQMMAQQQAEAQQMAQMGQQQPGAESMQPGGQGFNAAMGGMPPAAAAPGMTREFFEGGIENANPEV
jgi:hypothetical protein